MQAGGARRMAVQGRGTFGLVGAVVCVLAARSQCGLKARARAGGRGGLRVQVWFCMQGGGAAHVSTLAGA